jgi:hypothetical protein
VCRQFEVAFDTMFTDRVIENVLCKMYRVLNNCDKNSKWCNTSQPGQLLFNFQSNCVLVISPNGENKEVDGDAIVNCFPYGDRLLTMVEIGKQLGLPTLMLTQSPLSNYQLSDKIWCQKVQFDVEFNLLAKTLLSKEVKIMTKTILSKEIGANWVPWKQNQQDR